MASKAHEEARRKAAENSKKISQNLSGFDTFDPSSKAQFQLFGTMGAQIALLLNKKPETGVKLAAATAASSEAASAMPPLAADSAFVAWSEPLLLELLSTPDLPAGVGKQILEIIDERIRALRPAKVKGLNFVAVDGAAPVAAKTAVKKGAKRDGPYDPDAPESESSSSSGDDEDELLEGDDLMRKMKEEEEKKAAELAEAQRLREEARARAEEKWRKDEENRKMQEELAAKARKVEVAQGFEVMKRDDDDEFGSFGGGKKKGKGGRR
jgi:hypothetical protein